MLVKFWTNLEPKCVELIFNAPNVANLGFRRYDRNCHFKFDNYILIPRMPMPEE